jgi:hypothetical protein
VQGQSSLLKKLTQAVDTPLNNISATLNKGRTLKVLDELNLEADWQQQLQRWDHDILKPALQQCHRANIGHLQLVIPEYGRYELNPLSSWKFW